MERWHFISLIMVGLSSATIFAVAYKMNHIGQDATIAVGVGLAFLVVFFMISLDIIVSAKK